MAYKQQLLIQVQDLQSQLINLTDKINQTNNEDLQTMELAGFLNSLNEILDNHLNIVFDGDVIADIVDNTNCGVGNEKN